MSRLSFDIFCRVVDNFGDIGVCWRLARQLAGMPEQYAVRLWVDDLNSFARIEPRLGGVIPGALLDGVDIVHWTAPAPDLAPHAVVIEAFACNPPPPFIARMRQRDSVWINLEYLSAERWVASCHAMPSKQANGLRKAFFFPGFTPDTGGLLREPGLLSRRDAWLADPLCRTRLLRKIGVPDAHIASLGEGARQVLLFSYPDAPADSLIDALAAQVEPAVILAPAGVCPGLSRGQHGPVYVHDMPFVDQADFDRLLWSSDLNCVRGEDSLVRALWAGKPLLWHIYPQDDDAHMAKLDAWLALSPFPPSISALMTAWNRGERDQCRTLLKQALPPAAWAPWRTACASWSRQLSQQQDLASALTRFCLELQKS
ncbi:elongation factor P maturation arginine rhamnosyltransferase EarP [Pusillimonas sp. SM2304]|uniref:elongation factor P maturation arginine rhamnosyltransferase EarP n=1 Tax=Pusillimonas sp. SM2304 TaxID=3073241 RepID=UPI0028767C91|nr:elongation factor P maturation arginine rhamnosyltransferase EarP [Pusillimonas sp. SM2304]MDS1142170.1 elongation factor P maturation arginine rhamnosyltransferase EarP [Pusillimonas sp. SM2304]